MYVGTMFVEKYSSDADVGVSKGIAVFVWTFGFYLYLQFEKLVFLQQLLRENNDWLNVCVFLFINVLLNLSHYSGNLI